MSDTAQTVPKHLGLILDGNRRWAKERGVAAKDGHMAGYENLKKIVDAAFDRDISYVSTYIFSTENWQRTRPEVTFLLNLALRMVTRDLQELHEKGIKIVWLGSDERLSKRLIQALDKAVKTTKDNTRGVLALCFNYGGQQEIVEATQKLQAAGTEITKEAIETQLYGGTQIPPIDFLIRTSGEHRISNFMLWRVAYSELYFTDVMWPDFSSVELDKALAEYAKRQRRFGA